VKGQGYWGPDGNVKVVFDADLRENASIHVKPRHYDPHSMLHVSSKQQRKCILCKITVRQYSKW